MLVSSPALGPNVAPPADPVAIGVAVVSTLVVVALAGVLVYMLRVAVRLRREAMALASEARDLVAQLEAAAQRAEKELERVERMVGSAEAISDAVGSASRLVGGVVAAPAIKVVALGTGIAKAVGSGRRNTARATGRGSSQPAADRAGADRAGSLGPMGSAARSRRAVAARKKG